MERRLTERGERQAQLAGRALGRMGIELEAVLSSPKERSLRTATLASQAWEDRPRVGLPPDGPEVHTPLMEGFDARQALATVAGLEPDGRLLLVGHEPDFSSVVRELTGARIDLKKGGLAVVRLGPAGEAAASSASAAGELVLLLRPVELALIADV
jgi:phosphohistidine phosphatase